MQNRCPICQTGELRHFAAENRLQCQNGCGTWLSAKVLEKTVSNTMRYASRALYDAIGKEAGKPVMAGSG